MPGRAIAWLGYMFPGRGQVWASARRVDSPAIHLLFSLAVYAFLIFAGVSALTPRHPVAASPAANPSLAPSVTGEAAEAGEAEPAAEAIRTEALPSEVEPLSSEAPSDPPFTLASETPAVSPQPVRDEPAYAQPPIDVHAVRPGTNGALRAELLRLFESGPGERRGTWTADGMEGDLFVTDWQRVNGRICRLYTFTARTADDQAASGYHEACQTPDGWMFERGQ